MIFNQSISQSTNYSISFPFHPDALRFEDDLRDDCSFPLINRLRHGVGYAFRCDMAGVIIVRSKIGLVVERGHGHIRIQGHDPDTTLAYFGKQGLAKLMQPGLGRPVGAAEPSRLQGSGGGHINDKTF